MINISAILIYVLIIFIYFLLPAPGQAKTLVVGAEFKTIGEALKKAKDRDVIEVKSGEYRERLRIAKAVHLKGISNPVLAGSGGNIIEVLSKDVTIEGFIVKDESPANDLESRGVYILKGAEGAVIRGNRIENVMNGIGNAGAGRVKIEDNIIEGRKKLDRNFRGNCIFVIGGSAAYIRGNKLNNCRDGIYMERSEGARVMENEIQDSRYAIHAMWEHGAVFANNRATGNLIGLAVMYSQGTEIKENTAANNATHGLFLIQTTQSRITDNNIVGNAKGIFLYNSASNVLKANLMLNNGVGLYNWGGSEDNTITGNSFIGNGKQVKFSADKDQQWEHNYWSDYLGWDMNADGIGDATYESNTVVDHILWRYPTAKLLYSSASFQMLWMLDRQFALLKVPRVVDNKPAMAPLHKGWQRLKDKYPYNPEKSGDESGAIPTH